MTTVFRDSQHLLMLPFFCNFWCLSILIPANVGTCQFLGQSYGPRPANASILMKFYTLNKSMVANSMATIVFHDSWRLSNLTLFNIDTCYLLGHIFKQELQELQFGEILYPAQIKVAEFNSDNSFCDSWCLSILTSVNIGTCHVLGHKFGQRTTNASILMKPCALHKSKALSSMVTNSFL